MSCREATIKVQQHWEVAKAAHLLNYHSLTQVEDETGAEFEYLALKQMGINEGDSLQFTKIFY